MGFILVVVVFVYSGYYLLLNHLDSREAKMEHNRILSIANGNQEYFNLSNSTDILRSREIDFEALRAINDDMKYFQLIVIPTILPESKESYSSFTCNTLQRYLALQQELFQLIQIGL